MVVETAWKRSARRLLDDLNVQASRATPSAEVIDLFNKLRPVRAGPELIRLGGPGDGGYLIPDDLDGIDCCYSAGVGSTSLFEADLGRRGIRSLMADYSVAGPSIEDPNFTFLKRYVGTCDSDTDIEINRWISSERARIPMLQMDIEGGEYDCLLALAPERLRAFRIVALEVHHIGTWRCPPFFRIAKSLVAKLLADFAVVHLHANNTAPMFEAARRQIPAVIELTLLRKDRVEAGALPWALLPHPLDRPNDPGREEIHLGQCWTADPEADRQSPS
jgi:hypothetical protein